MALPTHVLVADASRARFFLRDGADLNEIDDLVCPQARLKEQALDADKPGADRGRHPMPSKSSNREQVMRSFAKQTADRFTELIRDREGCLSAIVAPPRMLGLIRSRLGGGLSERVQWCFDKDYSRFSVREIDAALRELINSQR